MEKTDGHPTALCFNPGDIPDASIDYRGLMEYSKKKGVAPYLLSAEEKKRFIIRGLENINWDDVEK